MQPREAVPLRQVPVVLHPGCQPWAGSVQLRARGTPHDAGHAVPIWPPQERAAQTGEAPLQAGVQPAQPAHVGFLQGPLEVHLLQPLRKPPGEPLRVVLIAAGAAPIIGVAAQQGLTPTGGLDDFVNPEVQGLVPRHLCQDRGEYTSYKVANLPIEFSTSIPRTQLRPGYGDGFLGAPLQSVSSRERPAPQVQGDQRGTSRTHRQHNHGGAHHV